MVISNNSMYTISYLSWDIVLYYQVKKTYGQISSSFSSLLPWCCLISQCGLLICSNLCVLWPWSFFTVSLLLSKYINWSTKQDNIRLRELRILFYALINLVSIFWNMCTLSCGTYVYFLVSENMLSYNRFM